MKSEYVLNHDYGYGREKEIEQLNKLLLRNLQDLDTYVMDIIDNYMENSNEGKVFTTAGVEQVIIEIIN